MKYKLFKLNFSTALHVGKNKLSDAEVTITADTLFSALCMEAMYDDENGGIETLISWARSGKLRLTDALPYHKDTYYIPKPMVQIKRAIESDSVAKKNHKKMKYIPISRINEYCDGGIDAAAEVDNLKKMGKVEIRTLNTIDENGMATPYSLGTFTFEENWGLYFLLSYEDEEVLYTITDYLTAIELSGIGGKRSSGLGKFTLEQGEFPNEYEGLLRVEGSNSIFVALTTCLPKEDELKVAIEDSHYAIIRRGGFAYNETSYDLPKRKKDLYMFKPGSSFANCFDGDVYDVSTEGKHPVYKYGMPIFLEVSF